MRSSKSRKLSAPTKKRILITLATVLVVLTSFFGGFFTQVALRGESETVVSDILHIMDDVGFVYDIETDEYVKLDKDKIAQLIAGNFLDGYSAYYTEEEYEALKKRNAGDYSGFGIKCISSKQLDTNVITEVICNSPAFNEGMRSGDKVVSISILGHDYPITNGFELKQAVELARDGQDTVFTVERNGESQALTFTVAKAKYNVSYVTYQDSETFMYFSPKYGQRMQSVGDAIGVIEEIPNERPEYNVDTDGDGEKDDSIAYIKLSAFHGDVAKQFGAAIEYMVEERGRTRLILDLCDNGGGSMSILQEVASYLLDGSELLIATASEKLDGNDTDGYFAEGYSSTDYLTTENNFNQKIQEITVLANRNTASASECLIGAMNYWQDAYNKGNLVIVGSPNGYERDDVPDDEIEYRTFGKGIMQTTYDLTSGGALKITTAKLLVKSGWSGHKDGYVCIHNVGIHALEENRAPDYEWAMNRAIKILQDN